MWVVGCVDESSVVSFVVIPVECMTVCVAYV